MKVLTVYPWGLGLEQAFRRAHDDVTTIDIRAFKGEPLPDVVVPMDMLDSVDLRIPEGGWDVLLLRPPCTTYSRASAFMRYRDWKTAEPTPGPRGDKARAADEVVKAMLRLVKDAQPRLGWVMENPSGSLRHSKLVVGLTRYTVTLCQYESWRVPRSQRVRKETDLYGIIPGCFVMKACRPGADCHAHTDWHVKGPGHDALQTFRGGARAKAAMPYGLSAELRRCFATRADELTVEASKSLLTEGIGRKP